MIVQSPARLEVASRGTDGNIMPLLASALMTELERHIVSAEQVKAKLTPEWRTCSSLLIRRRPSTQSAGKAFTCPKSAFRGKTNRHPTIAAARARSTDSTLLTPRSCIVTP